MFCRLELGNAIKELDEVSSKLESSNEKILSLQKQATEIGKQTVSTFKF